MEKLRSYLQNTFPRLYEIIRKFRRRIIRFNEDAANANENNRKALNRVLIPQRKLFSAQHAVFYLTDEFPQSPPMRQEYSSGSKVKMVYLAEAFPHSAHFANILYTVSSVDQPYAAGIIARARRKKIKILVNQNGVAYQAWHGVGWEKINQRLNGILTQADYIVYQSQFCRIGAEKFLAPPPVPAEVLYNPVDTGFFYPGVTTFTPKSPVMILGGNQYIRYRLELALQTLRVVARDYPGARLIVTGRLWEPQEKALGWAMKLLKEFGLVENVIFTGTYTQSQAPEIFRRGHILLHTQYNDASPTLVLEAMACGLPVAYVDSGGVPELVAEAGIGVSVEQSWEQINLPKPEDMANAVIQIALRYNDYSASARARTVNLFSLEKYVQSHRKIFNQMRSA